MVQRHSAVLNKKVIQKSVAVTNSDGTVTNVQTDPQATVVRVNMVNKILSIAYCRHTISI